VAQPVRSLLVGLKPSLRELAKPKVLSEGETVSQLPKGSKCGRGGYAHAFAVDGKKRFLSAAEEIFRWNQWREISM